MLGYDRARELPNWGHNAGSKPKPMDPMESASIVPFRRYAQILRELGTEPCALATGPEATQQLYEKYQEYRIAHTRKTTKQFFDAHKSEKWFIEKYGIEDEQVKRRNARKKQGRSGRKKTWLAELNEGKLDKICWDVKEGPSGGLTTTTRDGEEETLETGDAISIPLEANQILLRQIPAEVGRDDLEEALQEEPGFLYLALGEPHPNKKWARAGWASFDDAEGLQESIDRLNAKTIAGQKVAFEVATRPAQAKMKIAPECASSPGRLAHDLEAVKEMVKMLQREDIEVLWKDEEGDESLKVDASEEITMRCKLEEDAEEEAQKNATKRELDLHIDLLRQVYHCDYYASIICDLAEELSRRSPKHVRKVGPIREELQQNEKIWISNVDSKTKLLLRPDDNEIGELGGIALDKLMLELAAPYSQEDGEEKHRCTVIVKDKECSKPFKAQIFVQKHVLNKHKDFINGLAKDQIDSVKYFNNYIRDPQRVMPSLNGKEQQNGGGGGVATNGHGMPPHLSSRISHDAMQGGANGGAPGGGFYGNSSLIRMGGVIHAGGGIGGGHTNNNARRGGGMEDPPPLHMRLSSKPLQKMQKLEPLPSNPRPLDPRAALAPKRYEDLDAGGDAAANDIELEY